MPFGISGIQRRPIGDLSDADRAAMNADQGDPSGFGTVDTGMQPQGPPVAGGDIGPVGSGSGPREGSIGQMPPQMPTSMQPETPRVDYSAPAPGPSTATPSMSNEPSPVAAQPGNPQISAGPSASPVTPPPSFTPMQPPLGGQQIASAAFPIERRDPTLAYPITGSTLGPGPVTGGAPGLQRRMLGGAGGLLGGGLGVPTLSGGSTQEHTDIGNLIANLFKLANKSTQSY